MYAIAAFTALAALGAPNLKADTQSDRESLVGSWGQNGGAAGWTITDTPQGLHIRQTEGAGVVADFDCTTDGQNCDVKVAGHKAKVSIYFNGPALVEIETKGEQIVKRRFSTADAGQSMKVEVTQMSGRVQTEELQFQRRAAAASK